MCLSIVNAADLRVRRAMGYYAGKAAQEEAYRSGPVPVTLARTTAWFSLAETFLGQVRGSARWPSSPGCGCNRCTRRRPRTSSRMPWRPAALREGLLPRGDVEVDPRRFADWLTEG